MSVTAKLRYLRIAPRKVRMVADLIRGKTAEEAQIVLSFTTKRAAKPILKLLKSAIANAKHNFQIEESNLYLSKITVDEGPKYKRWMARARGQAAEIQKKTAHITLVLDEIKKRRDIPRKTKMVGRKKEVKTVLKEEGLPKEDKEPVKKPKPKPEIIIQKPKIGRGLRKIFRRKAF